MAALPPKPWKLDKWFDRTGSSWVVQVKDADGNQIGDAIVVGDRPSAMAIKIDNPGFNLPTGKEDEELERRYGKSRMKSSFLARSIRSAKNEPDVVSVDVPLLIRLLEFAREDAKTDMDLHVFTENLIKKSTEGRTLTMADYESLLPDGFK